MGIILNCHQANISYDVINFTLTLGSVTSVLQMTCNVVSVVNQIVGS